MSTQATLTIGIDVSKEKLDVWINPLGQHRVIRNQRRAIGQLLRDLRSGHSIREIALEPTGGYEKRLVQLLLSQCLTTYLIHPNRLRTFQQSEGVAAKTDKIAAEQIACYIERYRSTLTPLGSDYIEEKRYKEMATRLAQLKEQRQREINRLEKYRFDTMMTKSIKRMIRYLDKELLCVENYLLEQLEADEEKKKKKALLESVSGVG